MTKETSNSTPTPTTAQLLDALHTLEPSATRDLGIHLLESGQVKSDSTLAELAKAIKSHYAPRQ